MMDLKKILLLTGVLFLLIITGSLVFSDVFSISNSKADICILYQDTVFKRNLLSCLVKEFNAKEMSVTADTLSNSTQYNPADYDAVILLSAVEKFRPLPLASEYIKKNNYSGNIVYFSTFMLFNFPYGTLDSKKIDAITSASVTNDQKVFDTATNKIITRTMEILSKKVK